MNKTTEVAVYDVSAFHPAAKSFWISPLEAILESYPFLEYPHIQSFYSLLYIEQAEGQVHIDGHPVRLDQAKVVCIRPNTIISLDINRNAQGAFLCFNEDFFSLRYNTNVLYHFSFLQKGVDCLARLSRQDKEKWQFIIRQMQQEALERQKDADKVLRSYLNILLSELDRKFMPIGRPALRRDQEEKVIQFEKLLEAHFIASKRPSFYAGKLHITVNYLNRLCQENRHASCGDLIRKRVVIEAERLLHHTSFSVSEIAYKLGFESVSYFITFFKKQVGATPEHFRKTSA